MENGECAVLTNFPSSIRIRRFAESTNVCAQTWNCSTRRFPKQSRISQCPRKWEQQKNNGPFLCSSRLGDVEEVGIRTSRCRLCPRNGVAGYRKSVGSLILKPCCAMRYLTFPSAPRLSTHVVLMGSDEHSPRGTRVMTGRSRCGVARGHLVDICVSSSVQFSRRDLVVFGVVAVDLVAHRFLAHTEDGFGLLLVTFLQVCSLGTSLLSEAHAWHRRVWPGGGWERHLPPQPQRVNVKKMCGATGRILPLGLAFHVCRPRLVSAERERMRGGQGREGKKPTRGPDCGNILGNLSVSKKKKNRSSRWFVSGETWVLRPRSP